MADKKLEELKEFLKEAFCVDGDCEIINKECEIKIITLGTPIFKMTDVTKGVFYVIVSNDENMGFVPDKWVLCEKVKKKKKSDKIIPNN